MSRHEGTSLGTQVLIGCGITLGIIALVAPFLIYLAIRAMERSEAQRAHERQLFRLEVIDDIKAGQSETVVFDQEFLDMILNEPKCIENLDSIVFSMDDLKAFKLDRLIELENVKQIIFYDCSSIENALTAAKEMDGIEALYFDGTDISDESLRHLKEFPNLKSVHLAYAFPVGIKQRLSEALPNVQVDVPDPEP